MKKKIYILLTFLLLFFSFSFVSAKYKYINIKKIKKTYTYNYDKKNFANIENLKFYIDGKNECKNTISSGKIGDKLIITCLDVKGNRIIYINGKKIDDIIPKSIYTDNGILGIQIEGEYLYIDLFDSDFINGKIYPKRYIFKNISIENNYNTQLNSSINNLNKTIKTKKYFGKKTGSNNRKII